MIKKEFNEFNGPQKLKISDKYDLIVDTPMMDEIIEGSKDFYDPIHLIIHLTNIFKRRGFTLYKYRL